MSFLHGLAAEYLVMSDLASKGFCPAKAAAHLPYDLVADFGGRFVRIQVKAAVDMREVSDRLPVWRFSVVDGKKKAYPPNSFEMLAFVALPTKEIAYLKFDGQAAMSFTPTDRDDAGRGRKLPDFTLEKALEELQCASAAS